jgi:HEPN domain-containing protein
MSEEPKLDVEKQIAHWRDSALENWKDVEHNINGERIAFAMFATHLVIEKALKAHVVKNTKKLPPLIHNLLSLASLAGLDLTSEQLKLFALLNPLNIEARYLGNFSKLPTIKQAQAIIKRAKAALEWLIDEL